jgi:hypothetical protein
MWALIGVIPFFVAFLRLFVSVSVYMGLKVMATDNIM